MGIAHTRWSTYMHQVLENVYPLSSENGYVTLVVNGLIDNIQMIKRRLVKRGYSFRSSSAVEVVANLIEDGAVENEDPLRALHRAMQQLEGDYALLAVFNGNCKKIFLLKMVFRSLLERIMTGWSFVQITPQLPIKPMNIIIQMTES